MKKALIVIAFSILAAFCAPGGSYSYDAGAAAEDMDNYFLPAFPIIYSEIIDRLPADDVANISSALKGLDIFNVLKSLGDAANRLDSGDNLGAGLDAATALANTAVLLLKDEATKKIFIAGTGVAALPITVLITTLDITRKSYEAVAASKTALNLERLYYTVENDPLIKAKGRKLGEGDPINNDQKAVEHLWRRILSSPEWAELFKSYVTSELNQEWPEPSLWDKLTVSSDFLREDALLQEKTRLKGHIKGLLSELNKVAKRNELAVLAAQQMKEMAALAARVTPEELARAIAAYKEALKRLPEISTFAKGLPEVYEQYKAKIEKAPASDLPNIRGRELFHLLSQITTFARIIQGLPPKGRYDGERTALLKQFKTYYKQFADLRGGIDASMLSSRLAEEVSKIDMSGSDFTFKRYECGKTFDDVRSSFAEAVLKGLPDAPRLVGEAEAEIRKHIEKFSESYSKDRQENEEKFKAQEQNLLERIKDVSESLAAATDYRSRESLQRALDSLKNQLAVLKDKHEKYVTLFNTNYQVDFGDCSTIIEEIRNFERSNQRRLEIVWSSLSEQYRDITNKTWAVYNAHSPYAPNQSQAILEKEELEQYESIMKDNPGDYAGANLEFLKKYTVPDKNLSRLQNLRAMLLEMVKAMDTYISAAYKSRMTYYGAFDTKILPSLEYMASTEARNELSNLQSQLTEVRRAFEQTPAEDISEGVKASYKSAIEQMGYMEDGIKRQMSALTKAGSLAGQFKQYILKAQRINAMIADDLQYLNDVYRRIFNCRMKLDTTMATLTMRMATEGSFKAVPGSAATKILEEKGLDELAASLGWKMDVYFNDPFVELRGPEGLVTITAKDFADATKTAAALPTGTYASYADAFHKHRETKGIKGLLFELYFKNGTTFARIFEDEPLIAEEAKNFYTTIRERHELAMKNQSRIDDEKARYDIVLMKAQKILDQAKAQSDQGNYENLSFYNPYITDVEVEYKNLGGTRADIDKVLSDIKKLIAESKKMQFTRGDNNILVVQSLYDSFKQAYERRDEAGVMRLIDDDWEAADGTTLSDLEENLNRTFRIFDEVKFEIQGLTVTKSSDGNYIASYSVGITSRIYSRNLKHVEQSSVSEMVHVENGLAKIIKTNNGRFWYVE